MLLLVSACLHCLSWTWHGQVPHTERGKTFSHLCLCLVAAWHHLCSKGATQDGLLLVFAAHHSKRCDVIRNCVLVRMSFYRGSKLYPGGCWLPITLTLSAQLDLFCSKHYVWVGTDWLPYRASFSWPLAEVWLQGELMKLFKRPDVTFVLGPSLTTRKELFEDLVGDRKSISCERLAESVVIMCS